MKIALAQINNIIGDLEYNCQKIIDFARKSREKGAQLVVFPELALVGSCAKDILLYKDFNIQTQKYLDKIVAETNGITVVLGVKCDEFNCAVLIQNGGYEVVARKNNLTLQEQKYFKNGDLNKVIELGGKKFAVVIGDNICKLDGLDFLINITSSHFEVEKRSKIVEQIAKLAKNNTCEVIWVNNTGANDEFIMDGRSFVSDNCGKILTQAAAYEEDLFIHELGSKAFSLHPSNCIEKEIFRTLSFGLKDYCAKTGFKKVILGLSGGIDSAITAVLACDALGPENVLAITMPSRYSSTGSYEHSFELAKNLGFACIKKPIKPLFDCFIDDIQGQLYEDLAEENLQARLRAVILMAYSNREHRLLLSTGNKSEAAMGYCTLYGDMCGGLNLIADVYKTMIYRISNWINRDFEIIPKEIIEKAPSAELKEGQTDQDTLPAYDILDGILEMLLCSDFSVDEIAQKYDRKIVEDVIKKLNSSEYKRKQSTLFFRISRHTLGSDREFPIVQNFFYY